GIGTAVGSGSGGSIRGVGLEDASAFATYFLARARRRFRVDGSAFSARSRARCACSLYNSLSMNALNTSANVRACKSEPAQVVWHSPGGLRLNLFESQDDL